MRVSKTYNNDSNLSQWPAYDGSVSQGIDWTLKLSLSMWGTVSGQGTWRSQLLRNSSQTTILSSRLITTNLKLNSSGWSLARFFTLNCISIQLILPTLWMSHVIDWNCNQLLNLGLSIEEFRYFHLSYFTLLYNSNFSQNFGVLVF